MTRKTDRVRQLSLAVLCACLLAPALPVRADEGPARVLAQVEGRLEQAAGHAFVSMPQLAPLADGQDRTLAPYFYVAGGDPGTDRLPVKGVSAEVDIAGVIARVRVRQRFENSGRRPIEAVYVFPASTRAAVHGMRMTIGARVIEARIDRKQEARRQYEAARDAGRRASLLEQQRENVFTMNVANLMPGDRIDVELDYSELLLPTDAVYELVFPTVVGPRYGGGASPGDAWIASPYLPAGSASPFPFDVQVHLESGIAIKDVASPSHAVRVSYASAKVADIALERPGGGDRDFVLRYRLAGDAIEAGALLLPPTDGQDGYFVAMVEPPARPPASQVVPREYLFVLDVSGSMYGFPLETAKALMRNLLGSLRPGEWFNLVLFSGTSFTMSPNGSVPATPASIDAALELVDRQRGGGGTELLDALQAAYAVPRTGGDSGPLSRTVIVVTDGYVGVEAQAYQFVRARLDQANLFAFGIGSSVNRSLIEGLARAGQGEPFVVLRPERAAAEAERLRAYVDAPVLTSLHADFDGFEASDVAPQKIPDLMARRPIVIFGRYRGAARGIVRLRGRAAGGSFTREIDLGAAPASAHNAPLRLLWARRWVQLLDDERAMAPGDAALPEAITRLGLAHGLLTSFTSFVAVDSQVANAGGRQEQVKQPLPLPEGVSNNAVGGGAYGSIGIGGIGTVGHGYGRGLFRQSAQAVARPLAAPAAKAPPGAPPPPPPSKSLASPAEAEVRPGEPKRALGDEGRQGGRVDRADQPDLEEAGRLVREEARPARVVTVRVTTAHLRDASPVVKRIEDAVREAVAAGLGPAGRFTVEVVVDRGGRLLRLDFPGLADARLAAALRHRLASASFAALAIQGPEATVAVVIDLLR